MKHDTVVATFEGITGAIPGVALNVGNIAAYVGGYIMSAQCSWHAGVVVLPNRINYWLGNVGAAILLADFYGLPVPDGTIVSPLLAAPVPGGIPITAPNTNVFIISSTSNTMQMRITLTISPP